MRDQSTHCQQCAAEWSNAEPTATDRRERSRAIHGLLAPFLAQDRVQTGKYYESRAHTFTPDLDAAGLANSDTGLDPSPEELNELSEMGGLQGLT